MAFTLPIVIISIKANLLKRKENNGEFIYAIKKQTNVLFTILP